MYCNICRLPSLPRTLLSLQVPNAHQLLPQACMGPGAQTSLRRLTAVCRGLAWAQPKGRKPMTSEHHVCLEI